MPGRRAATSSGGRPVVRGLALLLALASWLAVAGVGGPLVGRLSEVQDNDNASFLPDTAESTEVAELSAQFSDSTALPFFVVFERVGGLTPDDSAAVQEYVTGLPQLAVELEGEDTGRVVGDFLTDDPVVPVPSEDGESVLVVVPVDAAASEELVGEEPALFLVADSLRLADGPTSSPDGLARYVTGPGGVLADLVTAFSGIDERLLQVTLVVVFIILLLVYRSPVLPFAALITALFALGAAGMVVYPLADSGTIDLNGQSQGILFILVVGAATDYALLLVARYREELHDHASKYDAMRRAWRASLEPIAASASTVVIGLLCLLLADLGSTRGLGPVGAIGVTAAMLAVLTFLPVLLLWPVLLPVVLAVGAAAVVGLVAGSQAVALGGVAVVLLVVAVAAVARRRALVAAGTGTRLPWYARPESGRWLFWPRVPRLDHRHPSEQAADEASAGGGVWGSVARLVGRRPRMVWGVTLAVLLGMAAFAPTFQASGIKQTDVFLDRVESVEGQEVLASHFPAGSGDPAVVLVPEADAEAALALTAGVEGVQSVVPLTTAPPGAPPGTGDVRVESGLVQLQATLVPASDSPEADDVVADLRERLDDVSAEALVGGSTAVNLDVRDASDRDTRTIIPAVLLMIFVVLMLLLRSVVAPLLLIVANVVSFAATIGVSALVFNHVLDLPGGDSAIPLYGFVFLVALGIDYSIFLMTRVREESGRRGTRPGVLVGLAVTGGVITSAGVVLASTFGALATLPILFLLQIAFIVSFGVLLDTLVVRSLLVPALCYDLGPRVWWPGRLWRRDGDRAAAPVQHEPAGATQR